MKIARAARRGIISPVYRVAVHANYAGTGVWTNMPLAEAFLFGSASLGVVCDLAGFRLVRLCAWVDVAGVSGAKLIGKYYSGAGAYSSVGSFSNIGTSEVSCLIDAGRGPAYSAWLPLVHAAKVADQIVTVTGSGGDGATDPRVNAVALEFV